jgi:hypothetical protein
MLLAFGLRLLADSLRLFRVLLRGLLFCCVSLAFCFCLAASIALCVIFVLCRLLARHFVCTAIIFAAWIHFLFLSWPRL